MIHLPQVAIVAIDNVVHDLTRYAIERCLDHVVPGEVLIFSDRDIGIAGAKTVPIGDVRSNMDAERLMYEGVAPHLNHEFALYVQWDSWIVRPDMWSTDFLKYDWIGAAWLQWEGHLDVGNGGFSLRSKRLLDAIYNNPDRFGFNNKDREDQLICRLHRQTLERDYGLKWAPYDLAKRFSVEHGDWEAFGFHGLWNMARFLDEAELLHLLSMMKGYNKDRKDLGQLHAVCRRLGLDAARQAINDIFHSADEKRAGFLPPLSPLQE